VHRSARRAPLPANAMRYTVSDRSRGLQSAAFLAASHIGHARVDDPDTAAAAATAAPLSVPLRESISVFYLLCLHVHLHIYAPGPGLLCRLQPGAPARFCRATQAAKRRSGNLVPHSTTLP
jgi:hypothetical protein